MCGRPTKKNLPNVSRKHETEIKDYPTSAVGQRTPKQGDSWIDEQTEEENSDFEKENRGGWQPEKIGIIDISECFFWEYKNVVKLMKINNYIVF